MTYFFVLMPPDWTDADRYLCRPIVGNRRAMQVPWLAIAAGVKNGNFKFVSSQNLDRDVAQQAIAAATAQQESQAVSWDTVEKRGLIFKKPYLLRAIVPGQTAPTPTPMDDLSCEQLVSPTAMLAASNTLSAPSLMAIIPKRGWLLVCPGRVDEFPKLAQMHDLATQMMADEDRDRVLGSDVFFWENGTLTGQAVRTDSSGYVSLAQPQSSAWSV
ncbi:hypothetical protein [Chamaesiphon sp. VAR_69_metabat_338]|uniref:hypothetical protein n=1 Tax=Chamaesiphon sp. VAR_69_metabat_338 TaxID=2964704 RepID=UPI00286E9ED3|nr:hypothetical protein [Chamaesiphon sp. VAR_69_metabat_338]